MSITHACTNLSPLMADVYICMYTHATIAHAPFPLPNRSSKTVYSVAKNKIRLNNKIIECMQCTYLYLELNAAYLLSDLNYVINV